MEANIVDKLLRGSRNMDRMKSETHQIVKMVLGLVPQHRLFPEDDGTFQGFLEFNNETCCWKIQELSEGTTMVTCYVPLEDPETRKIRLNESYRYLVDLPPHHATRLVYATHQSLPVFVEGMMKTFPELQERMKSLLEASELFQ